MSLFLPITVLSLVNIDITVKSTFNVGDSINFNYSLTSTDSIEIIYLSYIDCPNALKSTLNPQTMSLSANELFIGQHTDIVIYEGINSQVCTANVQLLSPIQRIKQINFTIIAPLSLSFGIETCIDAQCSQKAKIFTKGNDIYLDYNTDVSNPTIEASLSYPDKTVHQVSLPTSIQAEQTGTYELKATASKSGYWNNTITYQFAVIEQEANIPLTGVCEEDGTCDTDYLQEDQELLMYLILVAVIVIVLIIVIIFMIKRRNNAIPVPEAPKVPLS